MLVKQNGIIYFVLPFEFLQVQYAERLRNYLESQFNYIEITTFEEKVFKEIEQDICLVYLTNKPKIRPSITYKTYDNINNMKLISSSKISRHKPLKKWSNSIINDKETSFLKELSKNYLKISELGEISPGIVTGANDYFILNKSIASKLLNTNSCLVSLFVVVLDSELVLFPSFEEVLPHPKNNVVLRVAAINTAHSFFSFEIFIFNCPLCIYN